VKCEKCSKNSVIENPCLCKDHFFEYVEKKVFETMEKYSMIPDSVPLVATSGGKDSIVTLYLVNKYFGKAKALLIDEGIKGYRENTIKDLKKFCEDYSISYEIVSFKTEFNYTLDESLKKIQIKPCSICGVFRRNLLNKYSLENGSIYLGHNLDDEAQAIMMNYVNNRLDLLARLGPVSGQKELDSFSKRFKPLYFITEKQVMLYCILKGFKVSFNECPYAVESFRAKIRSTINKLEIEKPGTKLNIVNSFLEISSELKEKIESPKGYCKICGLPSPNDVCSKCVILEKLSFKN